MTLTANEAKKINEILSQIEELKHYLDSWQREDFYEPTILLNFLIKIKTIQGNSNITMGFVATLLAKDYLLKTHNIVDYDASKKPQGAPGLDFDETTEQGERIIAEIKTTFPYKEKDFGANQQAAFYRDFDKLSLENAQHKYMFVTERKAFDIIRKKYSNHLKGVKLVLIPEEETIE